MRFFCAMSRKPNIVYEQVNRGLEIASRKRLCTFIDGQLDTNDPHVIEKLKARPELFWIGREDVNYRALTFPQLVYEAERLGINTYKITKRDLIKALIHFDRDQQVQAKKITRAPTIEEIKEKSRRSVEKAKKNAAFLEDMETIEEVEVGIKRMSREDEIAKIEEDLVESI